jgi:predicted ABC-type transport system involved in lysophospholipase L1 biosynthesis ATPase subunit
MPKVVLQASGLKKSFASPNGPLVVLRAVDLSVHAGESVSIRGSSGSGKTTLLQLLGGIEAPEAGEVFLNHDKLGQVTPRKLLGHGVGFVFQNYQLMPELTALENVLLAAKIVGRFRVEKEARELLQLVGLSGRLNHLPAQLSGGECQRVAIARALINKPAVILADEPTGNLDEATGKEIMNLLLDVVAQRQAALVLVTHSREFAERANRRLVLVGGVLSPA